MSKVTHSVHFTNGDCFDFDADRFDVDDHEGLVYFQRSVEDGGFLTPVGVACLSQVLCVVRNEAE